MKDKMYIVVREKMAKKYPGRMIAAIAHSALVAHLTWVEDAEHQEWLEYSFKKVVVVADDEHLKLFRENATHVDITESSLADQVMLTVFAVSADQNYFKSLPLYK